LLLLGCVLPAMYWKMLGMCDHVSSEELMQRSGLQSVSSVVKTRRLRLPTHAVRQSEDGPANVAMNWVPEEDGKGTRGRPEMTSTYDILRRSTKHRFNVESSKKTANDCQQWRNHVTRMF